MPAGRSQLPSRRRRLCDHWSASACSSPACSCPGPPRPRTSEALRKELEQMRKQFETMKDGYEKAINQLGERHPADREPAVAAPRRRRRPRAAGGGRPGCRARRPGIAINPMELARPREPFSLYERSAGPASSSSTWGSTGDFIGNLTQRNVDKANAGSFSGRENRFFPREIELSLFGQIDPYARAEVRFEAGEEDAGEIALAPGRGQPDPDDAALRHPAQDGPDAQPLRPAQPGPRARPAVHRRPERARAASWATRASSSAGPSSPGWRPCPSSSRRWSASSTATTRPPSGAASSPARS